MKEMFEIERNYQVLKSGSWDEKYPDWDWETKSERYGKLAEALSAFNNLTPTSDCPIIRLCRIWINRYGQIEDRDLLDELFC